MQDVAFTLMQFMRVKQLVYVVALTLSAWVFVFPLPEVSATHENDHRFVVQGHITDSNGRAIPNTKVFVRSEVLETAVTAFSDQAGFYSALLHLHNADAGKAITVNALGNLKELAADFDPEDKDTPRTAVVDIVHVVPVVEKKSGGTDTSRYLTWGLVALVAGVSLGIVTRLWARRRKSQST